MMMKKLAPSPRDIVVSSPRSSSHRLPTGGDGGNDSGALSPRSEGTMLATTTVHQTITAAAAATATSFSRGRRKGGGHRPISPEISTRLFQNKKKAAAALSMRSGVPSNTAATTTTTERGGVAGVDTAVTHNNNNNNNMVESPTTAASATIEQAPTILTEAPPPARRSKRILVVDPKSGRKYDLQEDDHSLTDKELHVYHRSHATTVTAAAAAESSAAMSKPTRGTKSAPTSPVNNNSNYSSSIGGNRNTSNIGSLFVKKTTKNTVTSPSKTNSIAVPQSTLMNNDDDVRTYNSAALQLLMNDDAHTLETASALTEVSYYNTNNHRNFYYGGKGGGGEICGGGGGGGMNKSMQLLQSSSPFDCMLPTACNSVGEFDLAGEGAKPKKEGRDDVESMERGRYKHVVEKQQQKEIMMKNTGKASPYDDYQQQQQNHHHHQQQQQQHAQSKYNNNSSQPSPITAAFSAILDSPRMLFSGLFGNNLSSSSSSSPLEDKIHTYSPEKNQTATNDDDTKNNHGIMHPLASPTPRSSSGGGGGVVHHTPLSFRRVVCMVVFPQEVQSTLEGQTVGLLGMKFVQSGHDFQAHVRWVARGSKAERMGVRRGDIVSVSCLFLFSSVYIVDFASQKLSTRLWYDTV